MTGQPAQPCSCGIGRLTWARTAAGLSVGQAAKLLNLSREQIEADEWAGALSPATLARYADLYDCGEAWLRGTSEPIDSKDIQGLSQLSPSDQAGLLTLLESLP